MGDDHLAWSNDTIEDGIIRVETKRADNRLALRIWRGDHDFLPLIDASYGSVILSDTYSELSLMLPSDKVYGQGVGTLSFAPEGDANFSK